jgi:hypothetical protein
MTTPEDFESVLPGVQRAAFELLWPAVPDLEAVYARAWAGGVEIRCVPPMAPEDEKACRELLGDIFAQAQPGVVCDIRFEAPEQAPEWRTIISSELFRAIAREVAPWRLESGR